MFVLKLNYLMIFSKKFKKFTTSDADVIKAMVWTDSRTLSKNLEKILN